MSIKKIYYDANFSVGIHRGMGKYINNIIDILKKNKNFKVVGLLTPSNTLNSSDYIRFGSHVYSIWEQFSLPFFCANKSDSFFIFPYNTAPILLFKSTNKLLILHDINFVFPYGSKSIKQIFGRIYRKFVVSKIINNFNHILTVSHYQKKLICNYYKIDYDKVFVLENCVNIIDPKLNLPYFKRESSILHIGGETELKNSKFIIYAFAIFKSKFNLDFKLKILGIRNKSSLFDFKNLVNSLGLENDIEFLSNVSDNTVAGLYQSCKIFVFTSLEEGFGIPLIEAMNNGCPVLSSDKSCMPEVVGEAGLYFNPYDEKSLADLMFKVITNNDLALELIKRGYDNVKRYSKIEFEKKLNYFLNEKLKI